MLCNLPKTTLAYIRHELYRSQTMKQKPQVRVLIALVPAAFVFSDYDEYAAVSYSFTRVVPIWHFCMFICRLSSEEGRLIQACLWMQRKYAIICPV